MNGIQMKDQMMKLGVSGDPTVSGTLRGPQADDLQYNRVLGYLEQAQKDGLQVVLGGQKEDKPGYYIQPTIIRNVPEDNRVVREEIFGPVVVINAFSDEADAISKANSTDYGLYGSLYTKDITRAIRVSKKLQAGTVGINVTSPTISLHLPFGGWKESGEGRELGKHTLDSWTELKTVLIGL